MSDIGVCLLHFSLAVVIDLVYFDVDFGLVLIRNYPVGMVPNCRLVSRERCGRMQEEVPRNSVFQRGLP